MKVVLQYRPKSILGDWLAENLPAGTDFVCVDETDRVALARELLDADVLLHVLVPIDSDLIAGAPRLRMIQKVGVGVNTIDLAASVARNVAVTNMPGANSQAVAEHALGLMLAILRKTRLLDGRTRAGSGWALPLCELESCGEIAGRTVGFVGFGDVARRLARIVDAMGAKVVYFDRFASADASGIRLTLPEVLALADILTLHVPLTGETRNLIGEEQLSALKPGAVIINTARGGLIDETALCEALRSRRLAGAGLDVFGREPADGHPLFELDNVVVTPHVAWLTRETLERSGQMAIENVRRLADGQELAHRVA